MIHMSSTPISSFLYQLPLFIVYVIGLVISLVRWQRHPKISALIMVSMIMLLCASIAPPFGYQMVRYRLWPVITTAGHVLYGAGIGICLAAVFGMRSESRQQYPMDLGQPRPPGMPPPMPPTFG